jgi:tRNA 2-thiouridine synthesizing protein A
MTARAADPGGFMAIAIIARSTRQAFHSMLTIDREVDARGLNCPLPILRTKKALNDMASGQTIRITATDPASTRDFQAFARQTGNELLEHGERDGAFWFVLKRR